jgi:ATP phosphoribosyltransferase
MISELSPQQGFSSPESSSSTAEILERFKQTATKIAIQKDGELTQISCDILAQYYGINIPSKDPQEKRLVEVSDDDKYGFVYARNKSICDLVAKGAVNIAVVGTDRLFEDDVEDNVEVLASYEDRYTWPLIIATPDGSDIVSANQLRRVATQYPRISRRFFEAWGLKDIEIVETTGSTELYAYIDYDGGSIDAVIDMSITGESLSAHNLTPWAPIIGSVYPVLIKNKEIGSA